MPPKKTATISGVNLDAIEKQLSSMEPLLIQVGDRSVNIPLEALLILLTGRVNYEIRSCVFEILYGGKGEILSVKFKLLEDSNPFKKGQILDFRFTEAQSKALTRILERAQDRCLEVLLDFFAKRDGTDLKFQIVGTRAPNKDCCPNAPGSSSPKPKQAF